MSAVGSGSQQHAEFLFFFLVRSGMHKALPQSKKKKPDRILGNHVHSAGVHEKEIRETEKKQKQFFSSGTKGGSSLWLDLTWRSLPIGHSDELKCTPSLFCPPTRISRKPTLIWTLVVNHCWTKVTELAIHPSQGMDAVQLMSGHQLPI